MGQRAAWTSRTCFARSGGSQSAGFLEIALTGVHLGSYGRDLEPRVGLIDLLRALSELDEDLTFRISSLEPMDCTPEIVELVAGSGGRFAPHFHLPLQHASDPVLRRMRRPYSLDFYKRLTDALVERLPHVSIGSDLIAGFPGETDEEFEANLSYLPSSPLSHLHVFPYSDRPGTAATAMADKVPPPMIRGRAARLRQIGAELSRRFRSAQIGTIRPALTIDDGTIVVTDNYLKLRIPDGLSTEQTGSRPHPRRGHRQPVPVADLQVGVLQTSKVWRVTNEQCRACREAVFANQPMLVDINDASR